MEATNIQILSISNLLRLSSPLTGTASLHTPTSPSPCLPPLKKPKALTNQTLTLEISPLSTTQSSSSAPSTSNPPKIPAETTASPSPLAPLGFAAPSSISKTSASSETKSTPSRGISSRSSTRKMGSWVPLRSCHLNVVGALESVSKVFAIASKNPGSSGNSIGFLTEITFCRCDLCGDYDLKVPLLELSRHSFLDSNSLYFIKCL